MTIRKFLPLFIAILLLASCASEPASPTAESLPSVPSKQPEPTPTYTGTWETTIRGVVYDKSAGTDKPIAGARIIYEVLHSYFPELQEGRLNKTISDEDGIFSLVVMVHDTDSIRILVEAPGFRVYEERFTGFDLVAGKSLEVELISLE